VPTPAFTIDANDQNNATNGVSRYAEYLRLHAARFKDYDYDGDAFTTDAHEFATTAFSIGQPPIMAPPYIETHRLVLRAATHWDEDGRPAMNVDLAMPALPAQLRMLTQTWNGWDHTRNHAFIRPDDNRCNSIFATLTARVSYADLELPAPRYSHDCPDWQTCRDAVAALVTHLNTALSPILGTLGHPNTAEGW